MGVQDIGIPVEPEFEVLGFLVPHIRTLYHSPGEGITLNGSTYGSLTALGPGDPYLQGIPPAFFYGIECNRYRRGTIGQHEDRLVIPGFLEAGGRENLWVSCELRLVSNSPQHQWPTISVLDP